MEFKVTDWQKYGSPQNLLDLNSLKLKYCYKCKIHFYLETWIIRAILVIWNNEAETKYSPPCCGILKFFLNEHFD